MPSRYVYFISVTTDTAIAACPHLAVFLK